MSTIQTLYDALIAVGVVIGISGALTLAYVVAGALFKRDELRAVRAGVPAATPVHPTDETRELVLR